MPLQCLSNKTHHSRPIRSFLNQQNQIRPRPLFSQPPMYAANAADVAIASYNIKASQLFEYQQRVRADLHSTISRSLGSVTLQSINSKHRFGTGSLSPQDLVTYVTKNYVWHDHDHQTRNWRHLIRSWYCNNKYWCYCYQKLTKAYILVLYTISSV